MGTCKGTTVVEQAGCCMKVLSEFMALTVEKDRCCVLRLKNGFARNLGSHGFADVKLLVYADLGSFLAFDGTEVPLEIVGEVQIILESFAQIKSRMHLCYEVDRGTFDHHGGNTHHEEGEEEEKDEE